MTIKRYARAPIIAGGTQFGTSLASNVIKRAVETGALTTRIDVLRGSERLDTIAGRIYGDASMWWIIAAASGIGWALQVPPGTRLVIPTDLGQISGLVG